MTQQDLFASIVEAPKREPSSCPHPKVVRIDARPHPDTEWWCTYCGASGLPAPPPRKSWE